MTDHVPKLLSGKELVESVSKKAVSLPIKFAKLIIPENKPEEKEKIRNELKIRKELLCQPRVERRNALSYAIWMNDIQKALVTEKKGSYWSYLGHVVDSKTYIYPEEALFMIEINVLLLVYEGVPVSIQQAYELLLNRSVSLDEYRVYLFLMKEGYKLIRHDDNKNYTEMPSSSENSDNNYECIQDVVEDKKSNLIMGNETECLARKNQICDTAKTSFLNKELLNKNSVSNVKPSNFYITKHFNSLINCYKKRVVHIQTPKKSLLPPNCTPTKPCYSVDLAMVSKKVHTNYVESEFDHYFCNSDFFNYILQRYDVAEDPTNTDMQNESMSKRNNSFQNIIFSSKRTKKVNQFYENINLLQPITNKNLNIDKKELTIAFENKSNRITQSSSIENYKKLALKLKMFLKQYNSLDYKIDIKQLNEFKEIINEYNNYFDTDFTITDEFRLKSLNDLSHSSDISYVPSIKTPLDIECQNSKKGVKRKDRCEDITLSTKFKAAKNETEKEISEWFIKSGWNKHETPFVKTINNCKHIKFGRSFLNSIKESSFDEQVGVQCWAQAKDLYRHNNNEFNIQTDVVDNCNVKINNTIKIDAIRPIIQSYDCKSVETVLNKLQIIKSYRKNFVQDAQKHDNIRISYDVYKPNVKVLKGTGKKEIPSYFLIIKNVETTVLTAKELVEIQSRLPSDTYLLVAVVSLDSIYFIHMENIVLPVMQESIED